MLPESIASLIIDEQDRQSNRFVEDADIHRYIAKLGEKAEILSDSLEGRCRGVVAYYCNDFTTRRAYISLVLVDPRDRGSGLGRALVDCVLGIAKRRGFASCRLEVAKHNEGAQKMYGALGFRLVESRPTKDLLEVDL